MKNRRILIIITCLLIFIFSSGISVFAQNEPDSVIKVGVYQNPPKLYTDANGNPAGIFIDLLKEIATHENWKLEFVPAVWNDCLENLKTGKIDLMPDVAFSVERNESFDFNKIAVLESWSQVYTNTKSKIRKLEDLNGKRIAILEGSVRQNKLVEYIKGFGYKIEIVKASSYADAFSMVHAGVADAAVSNHFFGEGFYQTYGLIKTTIIFNPAMLHFATQKGKNRELLDTIDNYMKIWIDTPESYYYQILGEYIKNPFQQEGRTYWNYVLIILGLIFLGGAIIIILRRQVRLRTQKLFLANKKLQKEEYKFRSYIENAPFGILVANENQHFIEANPMACEITGYSERELIQKSVKDLIPEHSHDEASQHFQSVVKTGKSEGALPFKTKSGEERFWTVDAVKISDNRFLGFINDITEDTIVRMRLHRLGNIFDLSLNEIYLINADTMKFLEVNQAAISNTGYKREELLNMTPLDLKLNLSEAGFIELIQPIINGEKNLVIFNTQYFRKDGSFYEAAVHLQFFNYENERLYSAFVLDITPQKKVENELIKLKNDLQVEVGRKTSELKIRVEELEQFREATIEREHRMEELRIEIEQLKKSISKQ